MDAIVLGVNLPNKGLLSPNGSDPGVFSTNKIEVAAFKQRVKGFLVHMVDELNAEVFQLVGVG